MDPHVNQIENNNNNTERDVEDEDGRKKRVKSDIEPSKQDNGDGVDDKKSCQPSTHVCIYFLN